MGGRRIAVTALLAGLGLTMMPAQAVTVSQYTIPINATATNLPTPSIVLTWKGDSLATNWVIARRDADAAGGYGAFGAIATPAASAAPTMSYTNTGLAYGAAYEYRIEKTAPGATGSGYVLAGLGEPPIESRGKLVLMVDNRFTHSLSPELARLAADLAGDGWEVLRHDVDKALTPPQIKTIIKADYDADPSGVKSVFLFGDLAVPYSGDYSVTHNDMTTGAQPSDTYYGDMNNVGLPDWTDTLTITNYAGKTVRVYKYHNVPGDGKFDQIFPPDGVVEIEVGRVDLSDMPVFKLSETELLRRYLKKNHDFRHKKSVPNKRVLIRDGWGSYYPVVDIDRNYASMVGIANVSTPSYVPVLGHPDDAVSSYLWAYGGGGGSPQGMLGVATSTDYANNRMNAVFTTGYGSYWHDWDVTDSLFRAPLAGDGAGLGCLYARGGWYLHDMGLGRTIGSAVRRSMSRKWEQSGSAVRLHQSLMGDPSLRASYVAPPTDVALSGATVSWGASPEAVAGYHVYRQDGGTGAFHRLDHVGTTNLVAGTAFTDPSPAAQGVYMVRAVKLESCPSGLFCNPSQGVTVSYPAQQVQLTETTDGVASAPRSLARGSYQNLQAGARPASGGPYVCSWIGTGSVPASGNGTNVTVVLDQDSTVTWSWTTDPAASVTFHWPEPGRSYGNYPGHPNVLPIEVSISDANGVITNVQFFDENQNLLGTETNSEWDWSIDQSGTYYVDWYAYPSGGESFRSRQPTVARYKSAWNNPALGDHAITVKATDILGGVTTSTVSFTVVAATVQPPDWVVMTDPVNGRTYTSAAFNRMVSARDPDGTITKVDYYLSVNGQAWTLNATANTTLPFLQQEVVGVLTWVNPPNTLRSGINGGWVGSLADGIYAYKAVATDNHGAATTSATVTIMVTSTAAAPVIATQPAGQIVDVGQTATFTVLALGSPTLSYRWQKNGTPVGGNSPTNITPAAVPGDNGAEYTVVVSNAQGSVTSSIAVLTVNSTTAPIITAQPTNQAVIAGQTAVFSVTASGTAPLSYQWRTNGIEMAGATNASHTTAATVTNDSGALFSVVVSNVLGSVTSVNAVLTVNAPTAPAIDTHPADQTVSAGQTATFAVTATGTAPLYYQWRTNGGAIGGATGAGYTTAATLTNDSGTLYSVVVSNVAGSVTSSNALLTVTAMAAVAAAITVQPSNRTVTAGQTASFSVTASGTAPLYYQWRTNAVAIGGATNTAYTTAATVTNNSGTLYSVVVSNTAGNVTSSNALLTVESAAVVASGLPFSDPFESYALGVNVAGTNGWSGAGLVTGLSYAVKLPPGYPLPKAVHSRVVEVSPSLQNDVAGGSNQNVAVDFMLQAGSRAEPETPAISLQAGLCVDTQGVVQVWHLYDQGGTWTQRWTALGNAPLGSGQWVRVSVWLDYTNNPGGHTLFRPALDGVVYPTAYGVAGPTNLTSPGAWYVCANSPAAGRGGARKISGFRLESDQPCRLDDFLVTPGALAYAAPGSMFMVR